MRELRGTRRDLQRNGASLLEVGALRTCFLLASEVTDAYACIPLAHIVECRADKQVVLDDGFIPTVLDSRGARRLATFTTELLGLLHQRGEALGGRVAATGRGAAAEIADFLMLQAINRYEPLLAHHADSGVLHPEDLCRSACRPPGSCRRSRRRRSVRPSSGYRHDRLRESFEPVIAALGPRSARCSRQAAIPIPIESKKFGISVATVADRTLYATAVFVLRACATCRPKSCAAGFPPSSRSDRSRRSRPRAPAIAGCSGACDAGRARQIPYHAGFVYFELDQRNDLWDN